MRCSIWHSLAVTIQKLQDFKGDRWEAHSPPKQNQKEIVQDLHVRTTWRSWRTAAWSRASAHQIRLPLRGGAKLQSVARNGNTNWIPIWIQNFQDRDPARRSRASAQPECSPNVGEATGDEWSSAEHTQKSPSRPRWRTQEQD